MKKKYSFIMLLLLTGILTSVLTGCGSSEPDPNSGVYDAVSAEMMGITLDINDFSDEDISIELKDGGKAKFIYEGDDYSMKWELDGVTFHAEGGGAELDGTLSNGTIHLEDMLGMGVNMDFVCDDLANGGSEDSGSLLDRLKDAKKGKEVYVLE
ncbi:MAG: hypothetical protein IJU43_00660 [Lachnospiraceae bacterium]|nr:hypothetical protein [Lachnospiraceae bacterium]